MIFPAGHVFRHRSTPDAQKFSDELRDADHLQNVCAGRTVTLQEPAELAKPRKGKCTAGEVHSLVSAWDKARQTLLEETGSQRVPSAFLPLARVIERLKAAA